jgi:hypothetical protein
MDNIEYGVNRTKKKIHVIYFPNGVYALLVTLLEYCQPHPKRLILKWVLDQLAAGPCHTIRILYTAGVALQQ